jgi:hypothetical protein
MRVGMTQNGLMPPALFSLYDKDMPTPFHHVELALHTDVAAIVANASLQLFGILSVALSGIYRNEKCYQLVK